MDNETHAFIGEYRHRRAADLQRVFDQLFLGQYHTCLRGGGAEPVYVPARSAGDLHRVIFRQDYFSSALHEVAHWCIAGPQRRQQVDYGYWYEPDGRDAEQQARFEQVEARPQALECLFTAACGLRFRPSADNLGAPELDLRRFAGAIHLRLREYCERGLPPRAEQFRRALCGLYGTDPGLDAANFSLETGY
jgi:elongation factor P hydroxylase